MMIRTFTAAALVIALSSATYAGGIVYQGGPKSGITTAPAPQTLAPAPQTFEVKKPYAQYAPYNPASKMGRPVYRGGPRSDVTR